jgi:glycosyltransferase involved in cell wall biosynthesis
MKILYFSPHPQLNLASPAGYGSHMRGTIDAMKTLGHDVKSYIAGGTELKLIQEKKGKFSTLIKQCIPRWLKETLKDYQLLQLDKLQEQKLYDLIKEYQPDLIYERSYYLMAAGVKAAKKHGVKHMLEVNAPFIQEKVEMGGYSFYLKAAKKIEKLKAQNADSLVVVSTALKQHVMDNYALDSEKILVCPNGINEQDWLPDIYKTNLVRKQYDISASDFVVGFVGSILPHHGVEDLIKAFHQVAESNWRLMIVGDGWPLNALKKQVKNLGIKNQVICTGNISFVDVKNYISLFNVGIMPKSNWYGSPVKIFEYGAMNIPVVAPNNSPVRDVMSEYEDGYLIKNYDELANALIEVHSNSNEAMKKANAWSKKVLTNYTWIAITTLTLARY